MRRTRVAQGIYRDAYGFEIRWREQGRNRSKRFPIDTPQENLIAYRDTKTRLSGQRQQRDKGGSFPRDAVKWLAWPEGPDIVQVRPRAPPTLDSPLQNTLALRHHQGRDPSLDRDVARRRLPATRAPAPLAHPESVSRGG